MRCEWGKSLHSPRSQCGAPQLGSPRKQCRKGRGDPCVSRRLQCPDSNRSLRTRQNSRCVNNAPLIRVREGPLRANSGHDEAVRSSRELARNVSPGTEGLFPKCSRQLCRRSPVMLSCRPSATHGHMLPSGITSQRTQSQRDYSRDRSGLATLGIFGVFGGNTGGAFSGPQLAQGAHRKGSTTSIRYQIGDDTR